MNNAKPYLKLIGLGALLTASVVLAKTTALGDHLTLDGVVAALGAVRTSTWAPVIFVLAYALATALALPGSVLTIAGGAVFGFWWGSLLNSIGANIGANAAFLLSRVLGREGIERLVGPRLQGLNKATEQNGFFGLLILRLVPLVPFNALNFGSGLTALRWRDYAIATVVGILPGTLVYTFFADALVQGSTEASHDARVRLWIAAALLVALSLIPFIARKLGIKLPSQTSVEAPR